MPKKTNCASFSIQTLRFLLVGAQKYYLPPAQGTLATPLIAFELNLDRAPLEVVP